MEIEQALAKARELSARGDEAGARRELQEILKHQSDNQAALLMLGGSYFCEGMLQEAEIVFERLVLTDPGRGQYSIALFNTLWKLGRAEEALEEIRRFLTAADRDKERETVEQYLGIVAELERGGALGSSAND